MKKLITAVALFFAAVSVQAFDGKCPEANLTDAQVAAIHDLMKSNKKDMDQLKREIRESMRNFRDTILSEDSTREDADLAGEELRTNVLVGATMMGDQLLTILYDIVEFEQRRPLLKCIRDYKKKPGDGDSQPGDSVERRIVAL